jgi:hypothetical protein
MKAVGVFLLSCVVHWMSFMLFFCVGLWIGFALGSSKPIVVLPLLHLIVVTALGYTMAVRWPSRWGAPFAAGLILAGLGVTLVLLAVDYGLSYPSDRSSPPPFWTFVVDHELKRKNAILWMAAPLVAWIVSSWTGYAFGAKNARSRRRAA